MKVPLGLQFQCVETLIRKGAVAKLRRAGDLSHEQEKAMTEWLEGVRATISTFREHESAVRACLKKEMGHG